MRKGLSAICMIVVSGLITSAFAQRVSGPEVSAAVSHAVSPPLRAIPALLNNHGQHEIPLLPIPQPPVVDQQDPVVQTSVVGAFVNTTAGLTFAGVGNGDYGFVPNAAPPDPNGSVGATQYVQWVNESFAVFNKTTGALLYGPAAGNTVFQGLGATHPCATNNDGDPIVKYDQLANRWILTQFAVPTGGPYFQCVAVSTTSDATGTYNLYAFQYNQFPDYPKLAVWPTAYFITFNMFTSTFQGARVCAYDRSAMLAGLPAIQVCFQLSSSVASLLPSDLDGSIQPPAGSPDFLMNFGTNSLNFWRFLVDFVTPVNSTLTGPQSIPVAAFTPACGNGGTCIPQPSTNNRLDSLGDRLMYRLAYRTFADGHESLVVNHSVVASGNRKNSIMGVRWYELRNAFGSTMTTATPVVYQQGTFAPDSNSRWMGSIAMDKVGNILLGYSKSSGTTFPSIFYTGRVPTDALGTMEAENQLFTGSGSQTGTLHRWGDYSSMAIDPVDDCTFFYTNEYLKTNGTFNWSTRIGSTKFPSCL